MNYMLGAVLGTLVTLSPMRSLAQEHTPKPSVVIAIRHAERADDGTRAPELSQTGRNRAAALVGSLENANISAIITSQLKRTRQTAEPIAKILGVTPQVIPMSRETFDTHMKALVDVMKKHAGEVVLYVGHEETIPALLDALGGPKAGPVCSKSYSGMYILSAGSTKTPSLIISSYGAPDQFRC